MTIIFYSKSVSKYPRLTVLNQAKGIKTNIQLPKILFEKSGTTGVVTFNRPRLNLINYSVAAQLYPILESWEKSCSRVIFRGIGDNFSAGVDLKWFMSSNQDPTKYAWVSTEWNNIYRISQNRIPYIAFMDGTAMGSGLMLIANARYRIATERTVVAMPEARIGHCAGAPSFLPKLNHHLGFYMALTDKRLKSKSVVYSGIATHFIPSSRLQELERQLIHCKVEDIEALLNAFSEPLGEFSLAPYIKDIEYCFSADTVEEVIERLSKQDSEWSREALEMMAPLCPTLLKVTLRTLQLGRILDLKKGLRMCYRVVYRCIGSYNEQEGLRSLLVDRTDRPNWQPRILAEVTDAMVDRYFDPLPEEKEVKFFDDE